jgi:hypothetical protein
MHTHEQMQETNVMTAYRPDVCYRFYFLKSKDVNCLSDGKIMSIILLLNKEKKI